MRLRYTANERFAGQSKYTLKRMAHMALDAIFSFSPQPMRFATRIGMLATFAGCGYFVYIIGRHVVFGDLVRGWGSVVSVVLILGGVQLSFLGIMGEYLARVFEEAKDRPLYILQQTPRNDLPLKPKRLSSTFRMSKSDANH